LIFFSFSFFFFSFSLCVPSLCAGVNGGGNIYRRTGVSPQHPVRRFLCIPRFFCVSPERACVRRRCAAISSPPRKGVSFDSSSFDLCVFVLGCAWGGL
jgi:hypothetical protein